MVWFEKGKLIDFVWLMVLLVGIVLVHITELVWFGLLAIPLSWDKWRWLGKRLKNRRLWGVVAATAGIERLAKRWGGKQKVVNGC